MSQDYHGGATTWYVAPMSTLEKLETGLKVVAMVIAFVTFATTFEADGLARPAGAAGTQSRILMWMAIALAVAVLDRLQQREVVSIVFVVFNDLAHWAMYLSLMNGLATGLPVLLYAGFMTAGDIAKMVFFATSGYTVRGLPRAAIVAGVGLFVIGYGALIYLGLTG
ncbi:MAG: hypothetical protein ACOC7M_00180 [Chloroflexota bacterium]